MNRKARRAAQAKSRAPAPGRRASSAIDIAQLFSIATDHHRRGELQDAERLYRDVLSLMPDHPDSLHQLGMIAHQTGRDDLALDQIGRAIRSNKQDLRYRRTMLRVLHALQRWDALIQHGDEIALLDLNDVDSHVILANAYSKLDRLDDAERHLHRVVALAPASGAALANLGHVLQAQGKLAEAADALQQAIAREPHTIAIYHRLAAIHHQTGDLPHALQVLQQGLTIRETDDGRALYAQCLKDLQSPPPIDDAFLRYLVRAISEAWTRPNDIAPIGIAVLKQDPRVAHALTAPREQSGLDHLASLAANPLLVALLDNARLADADLERMLTRLRSLLLENATAPAANPDVLALSCALAQQCFINEYVFRISDDEASRLNALRETLHRLIEAGATIPPLHLAAIAAFMPLHQLDRDEALLGRTWPARIQRLLDQQIREPAQERQLRATIPSLTAIDDAVSTAVRAQYEDNPYPRWIRAAPPGAPADINVTLSNQFPHSGFHPLDTARPLDILVAGCGTGQVSLEIAQSYGATAQVLAIDLSLSSLAYAKRQSQAAGAHHIDYAQADILKLAELGRRFDVIDASGVLHHMADPFAAWGMLVSLLRTNGCMRVGLYSATARRDVVTAHRFIAEQGYQATPDDIRRCRQDILDRAGQPSFASIARRTDFYSLSECRDLLFHVHEQRMDLPDIAAFVRANGIGWLGFEIDSGTWHRYRRFAPHDTAGTDLAAWQSFEQAHPETFRSMYQFWVQKRA